MGRYLDQLHAEFDELTTGITAVVDRAADDQRDVTDEENAQVERDQSRRAELETAIQHYTEIEQGGDRVAAMRGRVQRTAPTLNAAPRVDDVYDITREFPTIGDYAMAVHRATVLKDRDAIERLERATAHQMTADNPGLIPRPILGPVIDTILTGRPFINSITQRPLPTGKFDRPIINQHVAIGVQAAEKDLTASQKLTVGNLPVSAVTYAGHLNISRQDIKWTSPAILSLVYDDFANVYAGVTDNAAADAFVASVTASQTITAPVDVPKFYNAIYDAAAGVLAASNTFPDTLWLSPDVWSGMGALMTAQGNPAFPGLSPTNYAGSPLGLKLVVDANFAAATCIVGASRFAEWFEDVDGLMQVGEPDLQGQLVGYAGFGAFLNTVPGAFSKVAGAPVGFASESASSKSDSK